MLKTYNVHYLLAWRLIKNNGPANLKPKTTVGGNALATIILFKTF